MFLSIPLAARLLYLPIEARKWSNDHMIEG